MAFGFGRVALALAVVALGSAEAAAQPKAPESLSLVGGRATLAAVRIDSSEAPVIDGDLSDPAWARAGVIDQFRQVSPSPGAPASERTVVRIMYDEHNIYFGIYAYDSEPDQILGGTMARDAQLGAADSVRVILDPGPTRRNGYSFQLSAAGARTDSLIQNNTTNVTQWQTIWSARTRRVADGWTAEMAIPFRSLSYERGRSEWGFEFSRNIRRKNETIRWSRPDPRIPFADLSEAGTLTGIIDITQGRGLDFRAYSRGVYAHDWNAGSGGLSGTGGGNLYYKVTPALTGTLTYNPDFSDAPLDAVQVNTTRFSLFTPETRQFFLQDAAAFEFGGLNFASTRGGGSANNNGRPFFSRNIGLVRGTPVTVIGGGKLSGELGGFGLGAITAMTERTAEVPRQFLSVARLSRPVLGESKLGVIATHGDPTGASRNTVLGADFQFRDSRWLGAYVLLADAFYQRSFSSTRGQDHAYGVTFAIPDDPWSGSIGFLELGESFRPALGFVNRTAIRSYGGNLDHRTRFANHFLRQLDLSTEHVLVTGLGNRLESRENQISARVVTAADYSLSAELSNVFEAIPQTFFLPREVPIPQGSYTWNRLSMRFQTPQARVFSLSLNGSCCAFYDGTNIQGQLTLNYRPSPYFEFQPRYDVRFIETPRGSVDIHVLTAEAGINFTPEMALAFQAQYDNISQGFSFLGRYRWEFTPGAELFVAFGQSALIPGTHFIGQESQLTVRVGHTLQF